jgi:hypothetical protein
MKWLAAAWVIVLLALHQDSWLWKGEWTDKTLVFGFMPSGLAYHAGFTVLAAITLWAFTRLIWPKHLEELENQQPAAGGDGHP